MKTRKRIGSVIPIEGVEPHTGSFLDYGVIVGWQNGHCKPCSRREAAFMMVEPSGRRFADWNDWSEQHAGRLVTLSDIEALKEN